MCPIFLPKKASEYLFAHVSLTILRTPAIDAIWFIPHVSVTGLRDAQGANKAQLRVCLWWCFQKRLAFELVSKAGGSSQHGRASAVPWGTIQNTKVEEGQTCSLLDLGHHLLPLDMGTFGSQAFGLRLNYALAFLVLWFVDSRWWDFLTSISTGANSYNKSLYTHIWYVISYYTLSDLYLNLYLYQYLYLLVLWRTLTNTGGGHHSWSLTRGAVYKGPQQRGI